MLVCKLSNKVRIDKVNREEKKQYYRKKILNTYKSIIERVGFDSATIAIISRETGIAQGTIFNHFSTKGDLLIAVYSEYFLYRSSDFINKYPFNGEIRDWLLLYLKEFLGKTEKFPRDCLKALFSLSYNSGKKKTYLEVEKLDKLYLKEFKKIISVVAADREIDIEFLLELTYSLIMTNYNNYAVTDIGFNDFSKKLINDIDKLFKLFSIY